MGRANGDYHAGFSDLQPASAVDDANVGDFKAFVPSRLSPLVDRPLK